ncbi:MAG TPA: cyanophycin synthetase [Kofleriaceae bacterium]|nr:cyanophycin synthetase [Kofleriaceae bacterium]
MLARLVGARRFGVVFGTERMQSIYEALGSPNLGRVIHVGGTNGKGSTVAMIAALARAAGQRVATYTSPHLSTLRERVQIDGAMLSEAAWADAAERVTAVGASAANAARAAAPEAVRSEIDELTFFEQVTAIGFELIGRATIDVSVIEVGLGGRLDATNIVDPAVAVVTGVAMDHEAILGDSLAAIAREKAGIWKRGKPAIVGASGEPEAVPILIELAHAAGAIVELVEPRSIAVSLPGAHQQRNAAAAIAAVRAAGLPVHEAALEHVVHPGRFERIGDAILDGAHNPHGARALAETLRGLAIRPVLVLAISSDKDARAIIAALADDAIAIVATRYRQDRALPPGELAQIARTVTGIAVHAAEDLDAALATARSYGAPIVIAGSLFLVGEARVRLLGAPSDSQRVSDPSAKPT